MASLDQQITEMIAALGMNTQAQVDINDKKKLLANENIERGQQVVQDVMDVAAQKRQGEFDAQQRAIRTAQQLGNDINDPNSVMSIMVQDFRESTLKAREQRQQLAERQQVGFFDNPLEFLVNQVLIPDEANALKATESIADESVRTIQNMQALTSASAAAAQATKQTMTKESIAKEAVIQRAQLDDLLNKQKIEALGYDSDGYKILAEGNSKAMSMLMQQHSMRLADAANARASEMHAAQMNKIKVEELEDEQMVRIVNVGAAAFQKPQLSLATIKMMMKSPAQREVFNGLFDQGMAVLATGSSSVGATPGEAIINTLQVQGLQGSENKQARDFLSNVTQEAISVLRTQGIQDKDLVTPQGKAALAKEVNTRLFGPVDPKTGKRNERLGLEYKAALNAEAPGSIYKAAPLPELAALPAVRNNPLYEAVFKPAVEAGVTSSSPEQVYKLATAAVQRGVITDKQLVLGLSDFYKTAAAQAYTSKGLGKFGFPYRPGYVAEISSVFSSNRLDKDKIDFARPESVLSYHTAAQARLVYDSVYRFNQQGLDPEAARRMNLVYPNVE